MTTAELKKYLISEIKKIENKAELEVLKETIDFNKNIQEEYILNDVQRALIEKSRAEFKEGKGIPHVQVMKDARKWNKRKR